MKKEILAIVPSVITSIAGVAAVLCIAAASFVISKNYFAIKTQENLNNAVDGCLKSSLYRNVTMKMENKTDSSTITTEDAMQPSVEKCLDLKKISR